MPATVELHRHGTPTWPALAGRIAPASIDAARARAWAPAPGAVVVGAGGGGGRHDDGTATGAGGHCWSGHSVDALLIGGTRYSQITLGPWWDTHSPGDSQVQAATVRSLGKQPSLPA